jgi:16S rRNA (uracil1498-N3)-methyltransferase
VAVGPEGGFTEEEVALARTAGWQVIDLGPRILRVETAALALAARFALK